MVGYVSISTGLSISGVTEDSRTASICVLHAMLDGTRMYRCIVTKHVIAMMTMLPRARRRERRHACMSTLFVRPINVLGIRSPKLTKGDKMLVLMATPIRLEGRSAMMETAAAMAEKKATTKLHLM